MLGREWDDKAMTVMEAAAYLGVGRTLMWRMIRTKEVPAFRVGRAVRVLRSDLDRLRRVAV